MTEPTLDLQPLVVPEVDPKATIWQRWTAFDAANPHVRDALIRVLEQVRDNGAERYSMKGAFEVLRWSSLTTSGRDYKLNNDFTALYSRAIAEQRPDLAPMLALRERRAA